MSDDIPHDALPVIWDLPNTAAGPREPRHTLDGFVATDFEGELYLCVTGYHHGPPVRRGIPSPGAVLGRPTRGQLRIPNGATERVARPAHVAQTLTLMVDQAWPLEALLATQALDRLYARDPRRQRAERGGETVGAWVARLRLRHHPPLSQGRLGELLEVDPVRLSRIENGATIPSRALLDRIIVATDANAADAAVLRTLAGGANAAKHPLIARTEAIFARLGGADGHETATAVALLTQTLDVIERMASASPAPPGAPP